MPTGTSKNWRLTALLGPLPSRTSKAMATVSVVATFLLMISMGFGHPLFSWTALRGLMPLICILLVATKFQAGGWVGSYRTAALLMDGTSWAALTYAFASSGQNVFPALTVCIALVTFSALLLRTSSGFHIAFAVPTTLATVAVLLQRADALSITLAATVLLYFMTTALMVKLGQSASTSPDAPLTGAHAIEPTHPSAPAANRAEFHLQDSFRLVAGLQQELRRPLHAILGMAALAKGEASPENVTLHHRLDSLSQCSHDMLSIIEDAHDLCLLEADEFKPDSTEFELRELIEAVQTEFEAVASGHQLLIINQLVGPTRALGDAVRLRKLLLKVLAHIEQMHPGRTIAMEVWRMRMPNLDVVEFEIEGFAGTLPSKVPRQFNLDTERRQSRPSRSPHGANASHGIAVADSIARSLGGSLESRVDLDVMSYLLRLRLPAAQRKPLSRPSPKNINDCYKLLEGLQILFAEDHEVNAELLIEQLESYGAVVTHVLDGIEALQMALRCPRPDMILMDCQMPKMDGFEAASAIRTEEAHRGWIPVPIVALTALTMASEREHCLAVGMDAHLVKPFGTGELARTIWEVVPLKHLCQFTKRAS